MSPPDEIWTTRDGRKIAVGDMDESHVLRSRHVARERDEDENDRHRLAYIAMRGRDEWGMPDAHRTG